MAMNFLVALRVADFASAPLKRMATAGDLMASKTNRLTTAAKAANSVLTSFSVGLGALGGAMSLAGAKVEDGLARLATATETTTTSLDTALSNAEAAARDFSTRYSATVEEILAAQFRLATAGIAVTEQIAAVQGAYKFAAATAGDFLQASELLGSFLNTFGKTVELNYLAPGEKVAKITDVMSAAVQRYQLDMNNLNDSLKFLVGPASTLGLSISETAAFAGALNTAGFRGTLAGTAISNAFNKINIATEKLDLDPSTFTDAGGNLKSFAAFLEEVERKTANLTSIQKQNKYIEVFDIRAGRAIGTLIQMKDSVVQFATEMDVAAGITEKMANIMERTTSARFKQFVNSLSNIGSSIGSGINENAKVLINGLKTITVALASFVEENKNLIGATAITLTVIGSISAVMITGALMAGKFTKAIASMGRSGKAINTIGKTVSILTIAFKFLATAVAGVLTVFAAAQVATSFWTIAMDENASAVKRAMAFIGGLAAVIIGAVAGLRILRFAIISATQAVLKLIVQMRLLSAAASRAILANLAAFLSNPFVAAIAVAGAALAALVYSINEAKLAAIDASKGVKTFEDLDKVFKPLATSISEVASEITRLAKISDLDIKIQPTIDVPLGKLPFAQKATEMMLRDRTISAKKALGEALKVAGGDELGGFMGIISETAKLSGLPVNAVLKLADSFDVALSKANPLYETMSDLSRAQDFWRTMAASSTSALKSMTDGTDAGAESLQNFIKYSQALNSTDLTRVMRSSISLKLFETINQNLTMYRNSNSEILRSMAQDFENMKNHLELTQGIFEPSAMVNTDAFKAFSGSLDVNELQANIDKYEVQIARLQKIIAKVEARGALGSGTGPGPAVVEAAKKDILDITAKIVQLQLQLELMNNASERTQKTSNTLKQVTLALTDLQIALKAVNEPQAQLKTLVSSVENQFKQAKIGVTDYASALDDTGVKIAKIDDLFIRSQDSMKKLNDAIAAVELLPPEVKEIVVADQFYKDILVLKEQAESTLSDMAIDVGQAHRTRFENELLRWLDPTTNQALVKIREDFGSIFGDAFGEIMTGKQDYSAAFGKIADDIKSSLINDFKQSIGLYIADPFKGQIDTLRAGVLDLLKTMAKGGELNIGMDTEGLMRKIQDLAQIVAPDLVSTFNLDFTATGLEESLKRTAQTYNDLIVDASVKSITATSENAAYMAELQRILNSGTPTGENLQSQINELSRLLSLAHTAGATDAANMIESALTAAYKQMRGETGEVEKLMTASEVVQNAVQTSAQSLRQAIEMLPNAAQRAVDIFSRAMPTMTIAQGGKGLAKTIDDSTISAMTATIKADPTSSVLLQRITSALSVTGGTSVSQVLQDLRNVIIDANRSGKQEVVNIAETAMRNIMNASKDVSAIVTNRQAQANSAVDAMAAAANLNTSTQIADNRIVDALNISAQSIAAAANEMLTASENISQSMNGLVAKIGAMARPAASDEKSAIAQLIDTVINGINRAPSVAMEPLAALRQQPTGGDLPVTVKIEGNRNVNVDVRGSTGRGTFEKNTLSEAQIKDIIAQARRGILAEVNEDMRRMEDQLRRFA